MIEIPKKKRERNKTPTARPDTELVGVPSPYAHGIDYVRRVVDTLNTMYRRKQITKREHDAGSRIQDAFGALYGVMGGAMDFDRVRGGSQPGSPPGPPQLAASELLGSVRDRLYPEDWAVVLRVCGEGMSIEEAANNLYGAPASRSQMEDCGRRLREGLRQMADRWFPLERAQGGGIRSIRTERPYAMGTETVSPANVAHATKDKIYRSRKS